MDFTNTTRSDVLNGTRLAKRIVEELAANFDGKNPIRFPESKLNDLLNDPERGGLNVTMSMLEVTTLRLKNLDWQVERGSPTGEGIYLTVF